MKRGWKVILVGAGLSLVALRACSMSGAPINGVVIEKESGRPLPSAIVVVTWKGSYGLMHSQSTCYHVETVRADSQGSFHIAGWSNGVTLNGLFIGERHVSMEAFKPGFTDRDAVFIGDKVFLSRSTRSRAEYFQYLRRLMSANSCRGGAESRKNLYRLYVAVVEEAEHVAESEEERGQLNDMKDFRDEVLVNKSKPTAENTRGDLFNVNPADSYRKEDLLK